MKSGLKKLFLGAIALLAASAAGASGNVAELAGHPTWLKLIKFESGGLFDGALRSAVLSPEFFLAADGQANAESELQATLDALAVPLDGDPNEHAQCRFPARFKWLRDQSLLADIPEIDCPDFDAWIFGDATDSVSIIFATGFLGNPASYYGHTLLKFNSSSQRQTSELLDVTVNYGAIIPPNVGPASYIFNGATGGYNAGFSHIEYYFHDYNYGELELRDLWEYELNLSPDEVRFVMAHAWELLGREYVYYFFRRNCAYRMAEVLEIVDGVRLIPPSRPWTVPQVIVANADRSDRHGGTLVAGRTLHPSRQSVFYSSFAKLDAAERNAMKALVSDSREGDPLSGLPVESRQKVVDVSIDYLSYLMPKDEPTDSDLSQRYREILGRRFALPRGTTEPAPQPSIGPEKDRGPGYMSIGALHSSLQGRDGVSLRIRPAYYDALDSSVSHVPNSELSMVDIIVDVRDSEVRLRQARLFRVEAVNSAVSGLPGDSGHSWILGLGVVEQYPGCTDCLVSRFEGDVGRSKPAFLGTTVGAYIGGAVQDNRNGYGNLFARISTYINGSIGDRFSFQGRYESRYHIESTHEFEDVLSFQGRWELSRDWDMRLEMRKNRSHEAVLSVGRYW